MIQDKIKEQLDQLKEQGEKLQSQATEQREKAKLEVIRILNELGANVEGEDITVSEVIADIREANPTLKTFIRNLDIATYDNRFRLSWNSNMGAAYAKLKANKTYDREIAPRLNELRDNLTENLNEVRGNIETQIRDIQEKAKEFRTKIAG